MVPQRVLLAFVTLVTATTLQAGEPGAPSPDNPEADRFAAVLSALGPEHTQERLLERGVLASIARELHNSYAKLENLELRVRVLSGMRLLMPGESPEGRGLTLEELEKYRAESKQEAVFQWQMTNRSQFHLRGWLTAGEVKDDSSPSWEMVSRYEAGPVAVEAAGSKLTEKYTLAGFWEGREPRLLPVRSYHCGAFAMLPFSLVGDYATDNSPRAQWNLVFFRGKYDGVHKGFDGSSYHRVSWVQADADGSVNRVYRLYVNPATWRVAQIEELGPAYGPGPNERVAAVIGLSWQITEVSTAAISPSVFDPAAFREKAEKERAQAIEEQNAAIASQKP